MESVCVLLKNPSVFPKTAAKPASHIWASSHHWFSCLCPSPGHLKGWVQGEVVCNWSPREDKVWSVEWVQCRGNRVWNSRKHWRVHRQDHGTSLLPPQGSVPATATYLSPRLRECSWELYPQCEDPLSVGDLSVRTPQGPQDLWACESEGLRRAYLLLVSALAGGQSELCLLREAGPRCECAWDPRCAMARVIRSCYWANTWKFSFVAHKGIPHLLLEVLKNWRL